MKIHIKPELSHCRAFDDGSSYENRDEFVCILTIHHIADDEVYLSGLKGNFNRHVWKAIEAELKRLSIKYYCYERRGKKKRKTL